jgi:hypothetical protein
MSVGDHDRLNLVSTTSSHVGLALTANARTATGVHRRFALDNPLQLRQAVVFDEMDVIGLSSNLNVTYPETSVKNSDQHTVADNRRAQDSPRQLELPVDRRRLLERHQQFQGRRRRGPRERSGRGISRTRLAGSHLSRGPSFRNAAGRSESNDQEVQRHQPNTAHEHSTSGRLVLLRHDARPLVLSLGEPPRLCQPH